MTSTQGWSAKDRQRSEELFARFAALPESDPDRIAIRAELVLLHESLAKALASRFTSRGESVEDLHQVAMVGLIKAVDRFEPDRGLQFSTFATPTILGEIKRHFRDTAWALRVPRGLKEMRGRVLAATEELSARHGRSPTPSEIADHLGVPVETVVETLEAADAYATTPLDSVSSNARPLTETLGQVDHALRHVEQRESLRPLILELPERDRQVLMMRFFGEMTQSEIAREIGVSQMQVSRILTRTVAHLRSELAA
jgi:RNA polymerase sigma-B factor